MAKRFEIVKEYPGYDVLKLKDDIMVYDDEILTDAKHLSNWVLGSVTGYAIRGGLDPIDLYNKAVKNGHETHYAMAMGGCITDNPTKGKSRICVEYGDKIQFHGQIFIIEKAPNNNITLRKVD